jgi:hypothetical protein
MVAQICTPASFQALSTIFVFRRRIVSPFFLV